jgi:kynureninase
MTTLQDCQALDAQDPLRPLREHFSLPEGMLYLDGNSLGAMPRATAARVADVVTREWGQDLIKSWNNAGWFDLPQRLGNRIAPLIGAGGNEVVATDSTSVNLYKVLHAAIAIAKSKKSGSTRRQFVLSERANFPTDLYIAQGLCAAQGLTLKLVEAADIAAALADTSDGEVAVLMLTHVNYRTGAMHGMRAVTAAAHAAGALMVWDLAHSAGAVPVDLTGADADFAVGCGYKYLNGGPGAPAFVWVNPRHADQFSQPLSGWWGHAAPFAFTPEYLPAPGITRYLCGTQPLISLSALGCGLDVFHAAEAQGGMAALRTKSLALTDLFIALVEERCAGHGLALVTPRAHAERGSQVCLSREKGAYAIVQALIARNVVGDFRAGDPPGQADGVVAMLDILRFGFTPLYIGFEDVWNAVEQLRQVLVSGEWQEARFNQQHAVT